MAHEKKGTEKDAKMLDAFVAQSVPGFSALCEYGELKGLNVIIENHGGPSSYPRAMAAGVSRATVPTMAGMVIAISGLFCLARLDQQSRRALQRLSDRLQHD